MITSFSSFAGNSAAVNRVKGWLSANKVPQSIIIEGPAGSGRKTLAFLIAEGLVCSHGDGQKPCGVCAQCKKAQSGHPDIITVTDREHKEISVSRVREIRMDAYIAPNEAKAKVYIFPQPLNIISQNALLKVMEEPPQNVVFLFITERREQMLQTVQSRSSLITLSGVSENEASEYLFAAFPDAPHDKIISLLNENGGLIGRVVEKLSDGKNEKDSSGEMLITAAEALCGDSPAEFLKSCVPLADNRALQEEFTAGLTLILRDALAIKNGSDSCISGFKSQADKLSRRFPQNKLVDMMNTADRMNRRVKENPNAALFTALLSSELFKKSA